MEHRVGAVVTRLCLTHRWSAGWWWNVTSASSRRGSAWYAVDQPVGWISELAPSTRAHLVQRRRPQACGNAVSHWQIRVVLPLPKKLVAHSGVRPRRHIKQPLFRGQGTASFGDAEYCFRLPSHTSPTPTKQPQPPPPALTATAPSTHTTAWSVTCESIAQSLANQCLEHQPTLTALASTAHTALAPSRIAWVYSATCASTRAELTTIPIQPRHPTHPPRPDPTSPHRHTRRPPPPPPPTPLLPLQLTPTPPTSHAHIVHAPSPHASAWSVTCESIAQRLANQCLEHQPTPTALASAAQTALAPSRIAWVYSATCASTTTCVDRTAHGDGRFSQVFTFRSLNFLNCACVSSFGPEVRAFKDRSRYRFSSRTVSLLIISEPTEVIYPRHVQPTHSARSKTATTRSCIYPYSFISQQSKRISSKVSAANLPGRSSAGRTICVSNNRSGGGFLVNTAEQLNVIPPWHAVWTPQHPSGLPKCVFDAASPEILEHLVDPSGIHSLPSKFAAIRDFPPSSSKRQLQRFLDMVDFYSRFHLNCAKTILLFTILLSGLKVDASNVAIDAVLQQHLAGNTQPSAFYSKKLSSAGTRYSTFGRVLLAVFPTAKHFPHFLEGRNFTVFSDHMPPSFVLKSTSDKLKTREIHQLAYISQFALDIRHIDGSHNEMADVMSRPSIAHLQLFPEIDLAEIAAEQRHVRSPCDEDASGLQLQDLPLTTGNSITLCDVFTTSPVPLCRQPFVARSSPPCTTYRTVGVELPTSCFPTVSSGLGCTKISKHGHGRVSAVSRISFMGTTKLASAPSPFRMHDSVMSTWTS
nr:unnamed protein product [Spirometra erinaceieuropaei]